jgi:hypothetical protein
MAKKIEKLNFFKVEYIQRNHYRMVKNTISVHIISTMGKLRFKEIKKNDSKNGLFKYYD